LRTDVAGGEEGDEQDPQLLAVLRRCHFLDRLCSGPILPF
jgi:hypothetical protein